MHDSTMCGARSWRIVIIAEENVRKSFFLLLFFNTLNAADQACGSGTGRELFWQPRWVEDAATPLISRDDKIIRVMSTVNSILYRTQTCNERQRDIFEILAFIEFSASLIHHNNDSPLTVFFVCIHCRGVLYSLVSKPGIVSQMNSLRIRTNARDSCVIRN